MTTKTAAEKQAPDIITSIRITPERKRKIVQYRLEYEMEHNRSMSNNEVINLAIDKFFEK